LTNPQGVCGASQSLRAQSTTTRPHLVAFHLASAFVLNLAHQTRHSISPFFNRSTYVHTQHSAKESCSFVSTPGRPSAYASSTPSSPPLVPHPRPRQSHSPTRSLDDTPTTMVPSRAKFQLLSYGQEFVGLSHHLTETPPPHLRRTAVRPVGGRM